MRTFPSAWMLITLFVFSNTLTTMVGVQLREPLLTIFWFAASALWLGFHLISAQLVMLAVRDTLSCVSHET